MRSPRIGMFLLAMWTMVAMLAAFGATHADAESARTAERIRAFEAHAASIPLVDGQGTAAFDLASLMRALRIPGLSIAVIDHLGIAWAKAYGVTEAGSTTPVTTTTLFQAASISKTLTAVAALHLVEQGKLSLDEDVNRKLTSWQVPDNAFTRDQKVTLRRIMSHNAGLTVHGFPGYAPDAPLPTLLQILDGHEPANNDSIRVDVVPGTISRYSGGGVVVEQQLILDVTGEPFPQFMRETVLDPAGMSHSTFAQPLPAAQAALAASGTRSDGTALPGRWHVYPEMAAAGLWTTPTDLARFAIAVARARQGGSSRILSAAMAREMLTPQFEHIGLGFFIDDRNPDQFGHTGGNEGFESVLVMLGAAGQGVVLMANSDNLYRVEDFLIERIADQYGWKYGMPKPSAASLLMILDGAGGEQAAVRACAALEAKPAAEYVFDEGDLNRLGYELLLRREPDAAIAVFELNVQRFPKSGNVYDSLGEACMGVGQTARAIENYAKALELNPKNTNAAAMLEKLKHQGR